METKVATGLDREASNPEYSFLYTYADSDLGML
jgi:hypothetical protein